MGRLRTGVRAAGRGVARFALGPVELLACAAQLLAIAATCIGLIFLFPVAVERGRALAGLARRLASSWSAVPVAVPYRPRPQAVRGPDERFHAPDGSTYPTARTASMGMYSRWIWTDPATWRDLLWSAIDPFAGGALAVAPAALMASGAVAIVLRPWSWLMPLGVLGVLAGIAIAPKMLLLHGHWTRLLLAPASPAAAERGASRRRWFGAGLLAAFRCMTLGVLSALAVPQFLTCFVAVVAAGPVVAMWVLAWARWLPNLFRQLATVWSDIELPEPYLSTPRMSDISGDRQVSSTTWWAGFAARARTMWFDPSTWRDLLWLACQPFAGAPLFLPVAMIGYGIWGLTLPVLEVPLGGKISPWYGEAFGSGWAALLAGPVLTAAGLALAPPLLRVHGRWLTLLLRPTARASLLADRERLTARVEQLTETRTAATDTLTAELRRIERDLHDGAQARMVAVGMTLGAAEALIDRDPAAAKTLVAQAKNASEAALAELRGLVRGIHPPVLAERGLVDAVRALALDSPIPVEVDADVGGPVAAPVESALYFAVAEALTNAVRHSGADRIRIALRRTDALLRITVQDNGAGGADATRGSGLYGIERRLGSFDGRVGVDSPPGGPTLVTMELPTVQAR